MNAFIFQKSLEFASHKHLSSSSMLFQKFDFSPKMNFTGSIRVPKTRQNSVNLEKLTEKIGGIRVKSFVIPSLKSNFLKLLSFI